MEILLAFVLIGLGYVGFNVARRFERSKRDTIEEQIASLRRIDVPNTRAKRANVPKPGPWPPCPPAPPLAGPRCECCGSDK